MVIESDLYKASMSVHETDRGIQIQLESRDGHIIVGLKPEEAVQLMRMLQEVID